MVLARVAITGATGMLGRHLVKAIEATGREVLGVSRNSSGEKVSRQWDLRNWLRDPDFDELFDRAEVIIHAGAAVPGVGELDEQDLFDANVRATLNLASWARRRGLPMVFISGAIVYANQETPDVSEDALTGVNGLGGFYGQSKLLAEDMLNREREAGLRLAVLRPSSIYGAGLAEGKLILRLLLQAQSHGSVEIHEPVDDCVNLIHAADVAHAVIRVLEHRAWEVFNIAHVQSTSLLELAKTCMEVGGGREVNVIGEVKPDHTTQQRFCLNCSKAKAVLGWTPKVDLHTGLAAVLENRTLILGRVEHGYMERRRGFTRHSAD